MMTELQPQPKTQKPATDGGFVLEVLRQEFSKRSQQNPQYSMRAFAKKLGISHTLLSLLMNGHRKPSKAVVAKLMERLHFSHEKKEMLIDSLAATRRSSRGDKKVEKLSLDRFALISEYQHYAILSLLEVPDTKYEEKFIAKRLGISPALAKLSMQRLEALGIVAQDEHGKWKQTTAPIVVENTVSTDATRMFQRQLLAKSEESLNEDAIEIRDFSSSTFAMHPKHVGYALKRIREFRRQLSAELEAFGEPEEVYNLTVQLFPTSRRSKK